MSLAEEAVQEVFIRAWQAADRFDLQRGSLRTWLYAIARNVEIDLHRSRMARPQAAHLDPTDAPMTHDPTETVGLQDQIESALARLSEAHRAVIVETVLRDRP